MPNFHPFVLGGAGGIGGGPPGYVADAVYGNGTPYHYRTGGVTVSNTKEGAVSLWFRLDGVGSTQRMLNNLHYSGGPNFNFVVRFQTGSNRILIQAYDTVGGGPHLALASNNSSVSATTWYNLLASWRSTSGSETLLLYLNDSDAKNAGASSITTDTVFGYSVSQDWYIRGGGTEAFAGCLFDLWFDDAFIDFSSAANRAKFISGGKPVDLGATGQLPTGSSPIIFCHIDDGESASNFRLNAGTGGDFTDSGSPSTCGTSPTD